MRAQGYAYSTSTVYRFLLRLERTPAPLGVGSPPPTAVPAPRHVAGLLVQRPEQLTDAECTSLARLGEQAPTVATAYAVTTEFAALLRARRGDQLEGWLTKVKECNCKELRAYARGLEADAAAVQAGLTLGWSNGQTEGQVHRLKLLKRQSDGRAGFDLLRRRGLLAA